MSLGMDLAGWLVVGGCYLALSAAVALLAGAIIRGADDAGDGL